MVKRIASTAADGATDGAAAAAPATPAARAAPAPALRRRRRRSTRRRRRRRCPPADAGRPTGAAAATSRTRDGPAFEVRSLGLYCEAERAAQQALECLWEVERAAAEETSFSASRCARRPVWSPTAAVAARFGVDERALSSGRSRRWTQY